MILEREQFYLDLIFKKDEPNTYNILKVAGSNLGFTHSEGTKVLIGLTLSKIDRSAEKNPFYGKIHSPDSLVKMSEAKFGTKNPMFGRTGENNPKFGKTGENHPKSKKVFVYSFDLETKEIILHKCFGTCTEATKFFNCSNSTISKYLDKNKLFQNKWILTSSAKG